MINIIFNLADGSSHCVTATPGEMLMKIAKRNNFNGILAECGGVCACATCHVHIDKTWINKIPPREDLEREMLEFADGVDDTSRLSCQIKTTTAMDGLIVNVPASQYGDG